MQSINNSETYKIGDKFLCINDCFMNGSGIKVYTKGKIYKSEKEGCITDDQGTKDHYWDFYREYTEPKIFQKYQEEVTNYQIY